MYTYVLNFNQSEKFSDPARGCSVTSYRLSGEVLHRVLHSGGAYMTSHNKHHAGLNVRREIQKRSQQQQQKFKYVWNDFLSMSSTTTLGLHLLCIFFPCQHC